MSEQDPQTRDTFDRLLDAMPRIAEAVNGFTSEKNQRTALHALVRAIGLPDDQAEPSAADQGPGLTVVPPLAEDPPAEDQQEDPGDPDPGKPNARKRRTRKPAAKKTWTPAGDVNFRPADRETLREFAAKKAPSAIDERSLIAVYYMEKILGLTSIDPGHVVAAYRDREWRCPKDPEASLRTTASKRGWLNTSDGKAIHTTIHGQNHVEHDMPATKEAKPA